MNGALRAADADREAVAERLRRAHAEGRVDTGELEERLGRCYAAKTHAELERLVADLPSPRARTRRRRGYAPPWPLAPLLLLVVAVAVATHGHVFIVWPLLLFLFFRFRRRRWSATRG